jgi:hypothetical protein
MGFNPAFKGLIGTELLLIVLLEADLIKVEFCTGHQYLEYPFTSHAMRFVGRSVAHSVGAECFKEE